MRPCCCWIAESEIAALTDPGSSRSAASSSFAAVAGRGSPLDGVVLGDSVNLRAGPGTAYEVVAHLKGGTRVEVLGEAFGWLLVHPAIDLTVYVSREMVELKGDGVGLVTRDRVNLRSRAALDSTVLGQVNKGDLVRVIQ